MSKPDHDCGEACRALNDRQRRMHLLYLEGHSAAECYRRTASRGKKPSPATCETNGPRLLRSAQVQAALDHHRELDAERHAMTKARAVKWLGDLAEAVDQSEAEPKDGIAAIRQLGKMLGWAAPVKVEITDASAKYNQMVAAGAAGDDWATECALDCDISDPATAGAVMLAAYQKWQASPG